MGKQLHTWRSDARRRLERRFLLAFGSMELEASDNPEIANHPAQRVVRRLAWRYLFVLAAVAGLVVVDQAIVQPMLVRVNAFAPAINVAGRQRMLSQRLTKAALALREAQERTTRERRIEELRTSLAQWMTEHDALVEGDATLGFQAIRTSELAAEWQKLDPHYMAMVAASREIVEAGDSTVSRNVANEATTKLVQHEAQFLPTMDRIVKQMEDEAARVVFQLRAFALAIATLVIALLVGLGWFVVRPATRTIRSQVDELETRVAQRTAELAAAVESLQREVHEREAVELKNQRLSAELMHAERVSTMGHLTAGLAHELNQPLAAITNYTEACEVLLQGEMSSRQLGRVQELVGKAKRSAMRAGQIVRRMRNFVRPNAALQDRVAINALVGEIVELCRTEVASAGTELTFQLEARCDEVLADGIQIQQVLVNLVQNALQALVAAASRERRITVRTSNCDDQVRIDVVDTGPGFPAADPEFAFAPFHSTKPDGLGIGLSICRSIVENHRGKIWTESPPEGGAQVAFTLPLAAEHVRRFRSQPDCLCC